VETLRRSGGGQECASNLHTAWENLPAQTAPDSWYARIPQCKSLMSVSFHRVAALQEPICVRPSEKPSQEPSEGHLTTKALQIDYSSRDACLRRSSSAIRNAAPDECFLSGITWLLSESQRAPARVRHPAETSRSASLTNPRRFLIALIGRPNSVFALGLGNLLLTLTESPTSRRCAVTFRIGKT
jgi:hypothetical protein